jgi:hypothetical protein
MAQAIIHPQFGWFQGRNRLCGEDTTAKKTKSGIRYGRILMFDVLYIAIPRYAKDSLRISKGPPEYMAIASRALTLFDTVAKL